MRQAQGNASKASPATITTITVAAIQISTLTAYSIELTMVMTDNCGTKILLKTEKAFSQLRDVLDRPTARAPNPVSGQTSRMAPRLL